MKPYVTEKTYQLASQTKPVFTLLVDQQTTAADIKMYLKAKYSVDLVSVRYASNPGQKVRKKGVAGQKSGRRKAYLTFKPGQRLPEFDIDTKADQKAPATKGDKE